MTRVWLDNGLNQIVLQLEHGSFVDAATNGAITNATTSVKLSLMEIWLDSGAYSFNTDNTNALGVSGSSVNEQSWTNYSLSMTAHSERKVQVLSPKAWNIVFGAPSGASFAASLTGLAYPGDMSGTYTFSAPARPYSAPATPTVGIDGSQITASGHQLNSSLDKFWEFTDYSLETNDVWGDVVEYAGDRTSLAYTAAADSRYRGMVRARNANAAGNFSSTNYWYTEPLPPSGLVATRTPGSTTVPLSWVNNARYSGYVRVVRVQNGTPAQIASLPGSSTSFNDTLPLNQVADYYLIADTPGGINQASSTPTATVSVGIGYQIPNPPTSVVLSRTSDSAGSISITGHQNNAGVDRYWATIEYQVAIGSAGYGATTSLAGSTSSIPLSGWAADQRYRVRVRAVNATGPSAWVESNYAYTTPAAPTGASAPRQSNVQQVLLSVAAAGTWADLVLVQRSLNNGSSWTSLSSFAPGGSLLDTLGYDGGWYRFQSQTPSPMMQSAWSETLVVGPTLPTDTSKIPGVTRIYTGADRIRQVFAGSTRFWTDGEP